MYRLTAADAATQRLFDLSRLLIDRTVEARKAEPHHLAGLRSILQRHRAALDRLPIHRVPPRGRP
jgi:hypothetical protein